MLLILILTSVLAAALAYQWRNLKKLPKGPTPLPIIGNFHQFLYYGLKYGNAVSVFHHFEKIYGKVFTIWMGPLPTVYISDYEVAHETHIKRAHQFSKRFGTGTLDYIREGRGIIISNGEFWQEHRRFALQTLRGFGLGRNMMEDKVMEEFRYRVNDYNKTHFKNGAIEIHTGTFFDLLVGSIINQMLISERFEQGDKGFEKLKNSLALALENFGMIDIFFPTWFLESPLMRWRQKKVFEPFDFIIEMTNDNIQKRVKAIERGDHVIEGTGEDFLDAYLAKIEKDKREGLETTFNLTTLAIDISDLWQAGQETTSTTMTWAQACFLNNPRIVPKVREELWKVTAGNRSLSLCDRPDTPYFNATLNEVQRFGSIFNFNLFRHIDEDTVINGQPLAAGTAVTTQLSMLHTDETLFTNPKEFRPERFIEDHTLEKKLIPFGIGKRSCLGESLARAELYLILGNLIMEYDIEPCGSIPRVQTIAPFGLLNRPPSFNIRFVPVKV